MRKWCLSAIAMAAIVSTAFGACPNKCSGHGKCGLNDVCDCMQNWIGGDCSGRLCPFARAWHDTAEATNDAHYYAECANRGTCDREKGVCDCDPGYTGSGCRRLACPNDCSGHGTCDFIEEMGANAFDRRIGGVAGRLYDGWDREKIMGCKCDPWYEGHDCSRRMCPKGDDPLTSGQTEMTQAIVVDTAGVEGYLTYFDPYGNAFTTSAITFGPLTAADAAVTCAAVQVALRRLPNNALNTVTVTSATTIYEFTRDTPFHTKESGTIGAGVTGGEVTHTICVVTFKSEPGTTGYQHLLGCNVKPHALVGQQPITTGSATATCTVYETYPAGAGGVAPTAGAGTRALSELDECSGRGSCDSSTGSCKCFAGHMGLACQKQEALV